MWYSYRWLLISGWCVCLLLLSLFDLMPRWQQLQKMTQQQQQLSQQVARLPAARSTSSFESISHKKFLLSMLTKLAVEHKLKVSQLSALPEQRVRMVVSGSYANSLQFVGKLLKYYGAQFFAFHYQAIGNNEVRLSADLNYPTLVEHELEAVFVHAQNPFCGQTSEDNRVSVRAERDAMSIDVQDNSLIETLRLLAKLLHINVLLSPAIEGNVTLHVQHAHLQDVFNMLLESRGLEKIAQGEVWYVAPREELIKREQQKVKWQNLAYQASDLQIMTWQIRYAKAEDIARMLQNGKASFLSPRGQVRVDARSNVLCVQDIAARMIVIKQLIAKLDKPIQQVRIEARLASVDSDTERELGVDFSVQARGATTVTPGRYSFAVAHLPDGSLLDIKLAALENSGRANIISSPSLYTANQQPATIEAGEELPYQEVSESGGTAVAFKKAVLALKVTPQILPGGYVLLQLHINQDRPSSRLVLGVPTIATHQILTSVLVKSGQTAVLGGIYEDQDENAVRRIPLIGNVPIIGELFTMRAARQTKRELLIFVTPKIMMQP